MMRHMFNLATALSLVLCVTTTVLWVRSYIVSDGLTWRSKSEAIPGVNCLSVGSGRGGMAVWRTWENLAHSPDGFAWTRGKPSGYFHNFDWTFDSVGKKGHWLGMGYLEDARSSSFFY